MRISDWSSDVCSSDLLAGCDGAPTARVTAYTISLGTPGAMAEQAATAAADGYRLLKIKLTGEDDRLRVAGVRRGAPDARLIVDANESWGEVDILSEADALADMGVEMLEQTVPVGADALLEDRKSVVSGKRVSVRVDPGGG